MTTATLSIPPRALPKGPRSPGLFQALRFANHPFEQMAECRATLGDVFSLKLLPGFDTIVFCDPAANKEILANDALPIGEMSRVAFEDIIGPECMFLLKGRKHFRHRQLTLPPFHGERMRAYGETIQTAAARHVDRAVTGRPLAMHHVFQEISVDIIIAAIFGVRDPSEAQTFRGALTDLLNNLTGPLVLIPQTRKRFFGLSRWDRYSRSLKRMEELVYARIDARRGKETGPDILDLLLAAKDENGEPLSRAELRDELMTLLMAGHETSATVLSWCVYWLARQPQILEALRQECTTRDPEALSRLPYLDAFCKEVLRYYPVIPHLFRQASADTQIAGVPIKKDTLVAIGVYLTHHDPKIWDEPSAFRPERFLDRKYGAHEYLPFGGGVRRCIGQAFAMYEMKLILAALVERFTLRPASDESPIRRNLTVAPSKGARVILNP